MEKTIPLKILQYHLSEKIGSGFAGDVYHAWDSGLDRNVAIRIVRDELANDANFRAQIMTTALAIRDLSHPHLARFYGVENVNGQLAVVMEYVEGQSLKSIIVEKPLDLRQFLKLALQLSNGLKSIHHLNVTHRYITASNIILAPDGNAKLTDIGLAPTVEMLRKGIDLLNPQKLAYLAPEYLLGQAETQQADQYSLGVVFFEAVAGNLPFDESSRDQLIKKIENPVSRVEAFEDIHHGDILLLITKMMSPLPEDRFSSVDELIATIKEIDVTQYRAKSFSSAGFEPVAKSRIYLMTSLVFFLLVLIWLLIKGFGV